DPEPADHRDDPDRRRLPPEADPQPDQMGGRPCPAAGGPRPWHRLRRGPCPRPSLYRHRPAPADAGGALRLPPRPPLRGRGARRADLTANRLTMRQDGVAVERKPGRPRGPGSADGTMANPTTRQILVPHGAAHFPLAAPGPTRRYAFLLVPGFTILAFSS